MTRTQWEKEIDLTHAKHVHYLKKSSDNRLSKVERKFAKKQLKELGRKEKHLEKMYR